MKKTLIFSISLMLLPVYPCFINIQVSEAQVAENPQGDLWGKNMGDQIIFWFSNHSGTSEYIVYRSTSSAGPWEELARIREVAARTGGGKVDATPLARLVDLCYKIEAIDANGFVVRIYEPMCVPKFVP